MQLHPIFPLAIALAVCGPPAAKAENPDFDALRARARVAAAAPYAAPPDNLADFWKNLTYDQHRMIRFQMDKGLWAAKDAPFSIDFFHPGWTAKKTVSLFETVGGDSHPLVFDSGLFNYGKLDVPTGTPPPPGYAGWRARTHLNTPDYMDEYLVFLGASYFRAIPKDTPYGLSARGISLNSGLPGVPEEFPDFTEFHLEKPVPGGKSLSFSALLEGPSIAGAYHFTVTPGEETVMDIDAEITLRKPVAQLGIAPFSSLFWFGESTWPKPYDFRPEVHDSDGLLMETADGQTLFRPLEVTKDRFRHCDFSLENPKSWALVQRDRQFSSYQDPEAHYDRRPDAMVEPLEGFSKGRLHLIEMPTTDETNDNVILLWEPQPALEIGKPARFRYRIRWLRDPAPSGLFTVRATRAGHPVQRPDQVLMVVDFAKPLRPVAKTGDPKWDDIGGWKPSVTINRESVKIVHVGLTDVSMPNVDDLPAGLGRGPLLHMPQVLRAFFVLETPPDITNIDMTCELLDKGGKPVSERWLYLWER